MVSVRTATKGIALRRRFWFEAGCAILSLALFVLSLFSREWIEVVFGVDPDGGDGSLELVLTILPLAVAVVSSWFARREYLTGSRQAPSTHP
jgi:hypothetical protein